MKKLLAGLSLCCIGLMQATDPMKDVITCIYAGEWPDYELKAQKLDTPYTKFACPRTLKEAYDKRTFYCSLATSDEYVCYAQIRSLCHCTCKDKKCAQWCNPKLNPIITNPSNCTYMASLHKDSCGMACKPTKLQLMPYVPYSIIFST